MRSLVLAAALAAACSGTAYAAGTFIPLETPSAQATKFSQNGEYLTAFLSGTGGVRWTSETGDESLVQGMVYSNGINNLGTVSGSVAVDGGADNGGHDLPAVAPIDGDPIELPLPAGTDNAHVFDVADNGTAVGLAWSDDYSLVKAYYWTEADGVLDLPVDNTTAASRANAVSADGSVIGGWSDDPKTGARRGVIWVNGVATYPIDAMGNNVGEADGVSGNGRFVVGQEYTTADGELTAWRWDAETGALTSIPVMPFAFGVSDDGGVVVGASGFFDFPSRAAYIWTEAGGSELLADYMSERGIAVPDGWDFSGGLTAVSGDGTKVAGWTILAPTGMRSFVVTGIDSPLDKIFADGFDGEAVVTNPVQDSGFEETTGDGGSNPYWDSVDGNPGAGGATTFYSASGFGIPTHGGNFASWFGGWGGDAETQYFSQTVTIPATAPQYINYWRYVADVPDGGTLTISVDGSPVDVTDTSLVAADSDYVQWSADVSGFADGGEHTIQFQYDYPGGSTDGDIFIDDVTIDETGVGGGPLGVGHPLSKPVAELHKSHR